MTHIADRSTSPPAAAPALDLDVDDAWRAVLERDGRFAGRFVYAVTTTGVFCRPTCPARRPGRQHVEFYPTAEAARRMGFRACMRCRPDHHAGTPAEEAVARACRHLATHSERRVSLEELAGLVAMSPAHLQRTFKRLVGVSPLETQRDLRRRASAVAVAYAVQRTGLGDLLVAATGTGVCAILPGTSADDVIAELKREFPRATLVEDTDRAGAYVGAVEAYLAGRSGDVRVPLDLRGTDFQQRVWNALRRIPPGETRSYAEIAASIDRPGTARAVGAACAANRIALAVPCHRVRRADGTLGGFRWGDELKRRLLEIEARVAAGGGTGSSRSTAVISSR